MKVRFSLRSWFAGLIYFFFTALPAAFFAELLAAPLAVCGSGCTDGNRLVQYLEIDLQSDRTAVHAS
jgi:hypothetical protein